MPKYLLIIKADTNDADYVEETHEINEEDNFDFERLKKIVGIVKEQKGHNWGIGEYCNNDEMPSVVYKDKLTKDEIEWFNDLAPHGGYGIHTIKSIKLYEITSKEELL